MCIGIDRTNIRIQELQGQGHIYTNIGVTFMLIPKYVLFLSHFILKMGIHLPEMSSIFREMSANQVCAVHGFSHACVYNAQYSKELLCREVSEPTLC